MLVEEICSLLLLLRTLVRMRNRTHKRAGFLLNQISLPPLFHDRIFFEESYHLLGLRANKKEAFHFTNHRGEGKTERGEIRSP